jgi:hypothetical protein
MAFVERSTPQVPDAKRQGFRPGRHYEHTVDALALRADEGRGNAAISVREARAADERTISEWGNPLVSGPAPGNRREPGELKHLMYPEEEKAVP